MFNKLDNDGAHIYMDSMNWTRVKSIRYDFDGLFEICADGEELQGWDWMEIEVVPKVFKYLL